MWVWECTQQGLQSSMFVCIFCSFMLYFLLTFLKVVLQMIASFNSNSRFYKKKAVGSLFGC